MNNCVQYIVFCQRKYGSLDICREFVNVVNFAVGRDEVHFCMKIG